MKQYAERCTWNAERPSRRRPAWPAGSLVCAAVLLCAAAAALAGAAAASAGTAHADTAPDRVRISLTQPGMYAVSAADIAAGLGISTEAARALVSSGGLRLTWQGAAVATSASSGGASLVFYGAGLSTPYSDTDVYFLARGAARPMAKAAARPRGTPQTSFIEHLHAEQDRLPLVSLFHDPEADFWLWNYVIAGDPTAGTRSFSFDAPGVLAGQSLGVSLLGMSETGKGRHHVTVKLNGMELGDVRLDAHEAVMAAFKLPPKALRSGANELQLTGIRDEGVSTSLVALDSIDVTYERAAIAVAGRLTLTADRAGAVRVGGIGAGGAQVYDVTTPAAPVVLTGTLAGGAGASSSVRFAAAAKHRYAVATSSGLLRPLRTEGAVAPGLMASGAGAEYVVVTAPQLLTGADALAAWHASQGTSTAVVTTQQIYDELNGGVSSPLAIRSFLAAAVAKWKPAPRFVVLAGEGSFDYRDVQGHGDSMVPPLLSDGPYGLVPSDALLAGDGVPPFALGRIPASTSAELTAYVDKLKRYTAAPTAQDVLFAADGADWGGDFGADSDALTGLVPAPFVVEKAYLGLEPLTTARAQLTAAFSGGAVLVNFLGHGGTDRLTTDGLLTDADLPALKSATREPLLAAMTCMVGDFAIPGIDALGESLTMKADGGAIAVFAPTSMEMNNDSRLLDAKLLPALFAVAHPALGTAVREALLAYIVAGGDAALVRSYALLGDPGLVLIK